MIRSHCLPLAICAISCIQAAEPKLETSAAFDRYVKLTEDEFAKHQGPEDFLWLDRHPKEKTLAWLQQGILRPMQTLDNGAPLAVPGGVIQHWLAVAYLERGDVDLEHTRGLLTNFAGYKDFFPQQIIDSKMTRHEGNQTDFVLRFHKKQFKTTVLNVSETATYTLIDPTRWTVACRSTHVGEAEHPKDKKKLDQERSAEDSAGYLWRLNFYWRVHLEDNGAYVELEVITLAREEGGRLNASRLLADFQDFPQDLTKYLMASVETIFIRKR